MLQILTVNPDENWIPQAARNVTDADDGFLCGKRYLLMDRDSKFSEAFRITLEGEPATEQCVILHNVNFLNNADVDGKLLPPAGAPNMMMAAGDTQLDKIFEASTIDVWQFPADWENPANTN